MSATLRVLGRGEDPVTDWSDEELLIGLNVLIWLGINEPKVTMRVVRRHKLDVSLVIANIRDRMTS